MRGTRPYCIFNALVFSATAVAAVRIAKRRHNGFASSITWTAARMNSNKNLKQCCCAICKLHQEAHACKAASCTGPHHHLTVETTCRQQVYMAHQGQLRKAAVVVQEPAAAGNAALWLHSACNVPRPHRRRHTSPTTMP